MPISLRRAASVPAISRPADGGERGIPVGREGLVEALEAEVRLASDGGRALGAGEVTGCGREEGRVAYFERPIDGSSLDVGGFFTRSVYLTTNWQGVYETPCQFDSRQIKFKRRRFNALRDAATLPIRPASAARP